MKKIAKIFILIILVIGSIEVQAKSSKTVTGIILSNSVEVMDGTSKSSKKIYTLNQGTTVKVKGTSNNYYILEGTKKRVGYVKQSSVALSFLLVDISEQKLYVYNNGKKSWTASVVTGKKGVSDTPTGHYTLKRSNFKKNTSLMGAHVDYWMPFITSRGIGFHDASWQSSFGGKRYIKHGSHGCVNMKKKDAKKLYETVPSSIDVLVRA